MYGHWCFRGLLLLMVAMSGVCDVGTQRADLRLMELLFRAAKLTNVSTGSPRHPLDAPGAAVHRVQQLSVYVHSLDRPLQGAMWQLQFAGAHERARRAHFCAGAFDVHTTPLSIELWQMARSELQRDLHVWGCI